LTNKYLNGIEIELLKCFHQFSLQSNLCWT